MSRELDARVNDWKVETPRGRPYIKKAKCLYCHERFEPGPKGWRGIEVLVREREVNEFRGDDIVEFAHKYCLSALSALSSEGPQKGKGA